jgi:microcin C transport system permease protein
VVASRRAFQGVLQGDLGLSYKYSEPVVDMMLDRLPVSLYFGLLGAFITYLVSIPLGVFKALWHRSTFDSLSSIFIFMGYAVPGFALGAVLLVYLGARLEWFPLYGLVSPGFEWMPFREQLKDLFMHSVLPLSCYVVSTFAVTTMMMKNNLMEHLAADYVRTAVSKGVTFRQAVWRHAFRNSLIPIVSTLGSVICTVVGGSILIERVFDIQGFGMLSFQALLDKDYSLIMGTLLLTSVLIIIGNLISDLLVALVDPRVRFE